MDMGIAGRRALVTGASRGIGRAVADALAAEGVDVALLARGADAVRAAAEHVARLGTRTLSLAADTTDDAAVVAAVRRVVGAWGGLDILVNAAATPAGPESGRRLAELVDADLRAEVETKVLGYLRAARAAAPFMVEQGWGRIVNVSGLAARQTGSSFGSIRNVAVAALTKNLADELGPSGVNVTVVHPALTVTERTPALIARVAEIGGVSEDEARARLCANVSIGRMITAEEVADVVVFLCSPRSVAVNGDAIAVGGGVRGAIYY